MPQEYLTREQTIKRKIKLIGGLTVGLFILVLSAWGVVKLAKVSENQAEVPTLSQISQTEHFLGNQEAPVVLIEYSDFQCPACKAFSPLIEQLHEDFPDELVIVYRHFPLSSHKNAAAAAKAAEAAGVQDKFWEMAELLFANQAQWSELANPQETFLGYGRQLGLDDQRYAKDYSSKTVSDRISADKQSGEDAAVTYTPTFYLNGSKIGNPSNYEQFKQLIQDELE